MFGGPTVRLSIETVSHESASGTTLLAEAFPPPAVRPSGLSASASTVRRVDHVSLLKLA